MKSELKRLIVICGISMIIVYAILVVDCGLIFSQDDHLTVKGDDTLKGNIKTKSLIFSGNTTTFPATPLEGEIFYNSTEKYPRYFNGTNWVRFGGPKSIATRVVAASDTVDGPKRADYVCDGTADQVEIQAAIDAVGDAASVTNNTVGVVYLLEGTFNISDFINLNNTAPNDSGKAIIGAGRGTVLKMVSGAVNPIVILASNVNNILISQLMLDGNSKSGLVGVYFFDLVTNSKIERLWVENFGSVGIYLNNSSNNTILHNQVMNNSVGVYVWHGSNNIVGNNNVQGNSQEGIQLNETSNNLVSGNNFQSNRNGVSINGSATNPTNHNIVINNNIQQNNQSGVFIATECYYNIISDNQVYSNTQNGISIYQAYGNSITNNNLRLNNLHGVLIARTNRNLISGNIIYDSGGSLERHGIWIKDNSSTNLVSANRIYDSTPVSGGGYGINIANDNNTACATCLDNYVTANYIDGSGYSGRLIQDLGANTKYTDKAKLTLERNTIDISTASYTLDVATNPKTYVYLNPSVATTLSLANGKAAGDILILEGGSNAATIADGGNVNLGNPRTLGQYDILKLIWNGSTRWLETEWVDN